MRTVFLIGNLASGKSTAARYLASKGARHIDLDDMAKSLYVPGSELVEALAQEFGCQILDEAGGVRFGELARRAFVTSESTQRLNDIVHPVVRQRLSDMLMPVQCCSTVVPQFPLTVVEVSVPSACSDMFPLGDDVIAIYAPLEARRERAIARGMAPDDFEARAAVQPDDEKICDFATVVIDNSAADDSLFRSLDAYLIEHAIDFSNCEAE
ncbi:MAG: dephospho-CoA kinase [Coriobacteriaceae bacterium]|nr:dephospho-CoA kinase [Coriobacteriaceae bacterium]